MLVIGIVESPSLTFPIDEVLCAAPSVSPSQAVALIMGPV